MRVIGPRCPGEIPDMAITTCHEASFAGLPFRECLSLCVHGFLKCRNAPRPCVASLRLQNVGNTVLSEITLRAVVLLTVASTFVANKLPATLPWLVFRLFIKIRYADEKAFLFEFIHCYSKHTGYAV